MLAYVPHSIFFDASNDDLDEFLASNKKMFEKSGGSKNQNEADLNAFLAV